MKKAGFGIIIEDKRVLLIKRKFTKKRYANYWAVPGGWQEDNESIEQTVTREIKEEVGLDFKPEKLLIKQIADEIELYRYIGDFGGILSIQEEECDGYGWFSYDEIENILIGDNMIELLDLLKQQDYL